MTGTRARGRRRRRPGRHPEPRGAAAVAAATAAATSLEPVVEALVRQAGLRADSIAAAAAGERTRQLLDARAEAARLVGEARAESEVVAGRAAAAVVVSARAEARGIVLAARRRAYEAVRRQVLEELLARRDTVEVTRLLEAMERWAQARIGGPAETSRGGPGGLDVVARRGAQRVVVRAAAVVDHQLAAMAAELEGLWS